MNEKNYKKKIIQLISELNENKFINIIHARIGNPTLDIVLESVLDIHQLKVFKEISALYQEIDSCKIEWICELDKHPEIIKYTPDDRNITGEIVIRPIELFLTFDPKLNDDAWQKNLEPEEKQQLLDFRYFDFNDDYIRVGYIINGERHIEDELFFILQNAEGFFPADIKFDAYLETMVKFKGYQGWQYNCFFSNTNSSKRMNFYIDQIFNRD